jgi:DNA mismatch repair protein MSH5
LGPSSPKVLAATHFHEIFEHGFLRPQPNLTLAHMEVLVDKKGKRREGDIATEVTYLYA